MIANVPDLIVRILAFLIYIDDERNRSSGGSCNPSHKSGQKVYPVTSHKYSALDRTVSSRIRRACFALADRRRVDKCWRDIIDGPVGSRLWYQLLESLDLDPPHQMYTDGDGSILSYHKVCQIMLRAEELRETLLSKTRRGCLANKTACRMIAPREYPRHPRQQEPPPMSKESRQRIAENTTSLKSFLGSIHYYFQSRKRKRPPSVETRDNDRDKGEDDDEVEDEDELYELYGDDAFSPYQKPKSFDAASALNRYRMFLKLKQSYPNIWFVPTIDIEFCWLTHILRTEMYWKDMKDLGINPNHSLLLRRYGEVAGFATALQGTAALWKSTFCLPYLPQNTDLSWDVWKGDNFSAKVYRSDPMSYFPSLGVPVEVLPPSSKMIRIGLTEDDIVADLGWFPQLEFAFRDIVRESRDVLMGSGCWDRRDMGKNRDTLLKKHLIPSYERFINLCNGSSKVIAMENTAPPYVIDLIWHAHQIEPTSYKSDCLALFGSEVWHHPWPKGLGNPQPMSNELLCTWKKRYGTDIQSDWKLSLEDL